MEAAPKEENSGDEQHQVAEDSQLFETEDVESQKTVLIVYAHQSMGSFNEALRDIAAKELSMQGYRIIVSDLYAMNFKANSTQDDIIGDLKNPELFQYGEETMHAWKEGRLSEDIVAEQRKVEEAELIIFQNKKAMLSFTTGATESMFRPDGINGDINVALWPLQNGTLHFCGFQVLAPQIFWGPAHCPAAVRAAMLEEWSVRLKGLLAEKSLTFARCEWFDLSFEKGFLLQPKVKEEQMSNAYGITTGHHLGKPLPPDNQTKALIIDEQSSLVPALITDGCNTE
ncbi:NAD(P)H dehydrogenase [quinone] 1 isoform X2 [Syngnathoides biaculeatus]|uniref:NAD(P)H dehydrogenase [quinone] 1 isoform X2 n=1 Tax=Syngnathoides biaculeatus TaxID=300417 RepID=UPI002ADE4A7F|nr:NAD(P)H dehydrogenase [quinone] 1 isoform X2 [Syngnathoides biaculeatus]